MAEELHSHSGASNVAGTTTGDSSVESMVLSATAEALLGVAGELKQIMVDLPQRITASLAGRSHTGTKTPESTLPTHG